MSDAVDTDRVAAQLVAMRVVLAVALVGPFAGVVLGFVLPRADSSLLSPLAVTLVAVAAGLWVGFTANSDAGRRLVNVKRGFAVHGDLRRLLREYLVVYLTVLVRLELLAVAGVVVARWGSGPWAALWVQLTAAALMILTWPKRRKVELLIARATARAAPAG